MKIEAFTYQESMLDAKRIYLSCKYDISFVCPECKHTNWYDHCVPFISYGTYCHVFYCSECGYESGDKMYDLNFICEDSVDVTFNKVNNLKVYFGEKEL